MRRAYYGRPDTKRVLYPSPEFSIGRESGAVSQDRNASDEASVRSLLHATVSPGGTGDGGQPRARRMAKV